MISVIAVLIANDAACSSGVAPNNLATWPIQRALLPHIDALISHVSPGTDTATTDLLLTRTGLFLNNQGATARAITYLQRSLTTCQHLHGEDHPDTLTSRNNLANAYQSAGDLGRAIPLHEQTLADCERVLCEDHLHAVLS